MRIKSFFLATILLISISSSYGQLQDSAWPKAAHDIYNTGESQYYGFNSPSMDWEYGPNYWGVADYPSVDSSGNFYVNYGGSNPGDPTIGNKLYCVQSDGSMLWTYNLHDITTVIMGSAIDTSNNIYIPGTGDNMYSLDSSGSFNWSYYIGDSESHTIPNIDSSGNVIVRNGLAELYSFGSDGSLNWSYSNDVRFSYGAGIDSSDNVCAQAYNFSHIFSFDSAGSLNWSYSPDLLDSSYACNSPLIGSDSTIYTSEHGGFYWDTGRIYSISSSGSFLWSYDTTGKMSSALDSSDNIYCGTYSLDPEATTFDLIKLNSDGALVDSWESDYRMSHLILDSSGRVYLTDSNKDIVCLEPDFSSAWNWGNSKSLGSLLRCRDYSLAYTEVGYNSCLRVLEGTPIPTATPTNTPTATLIATYTPTNTPTPTATIAMTPELLDSAWPIVQKDLKNSGHCAYNPLTPTPVVCWQYYLGSPNTGGVAIDKSDNLYSGATENQIYAVDKYGILGWSYTVSDTPHTITLAEAGILYTTTDDDKLYSLNVDGTLNWTYSMGVSQTGYNRMPIDALGNVYVGYDSDPNFGVYCLDYNKALQWSYRTDDYTGNLCLDDSSNLYGNSEDYLWSLASDGSLNWSYSCSPLGNASMVALTSDNKPIVTIDGDDYSVAVGLDTGGSVLWSQNVAKPEGEVDGYSSHFALGSSDDVYELRGFTRCSVDSSGALNWSYSGQTNAFLGKPVTVAGDYIYAVSTSNALCCLDSSGSLVWQKNIGGLADHVSVASDGRVYIGTDTYSIKCVANTCLVTPTPTVTLTPTLTPTPTQTPTITPTALPKTINGDAKVILNALMKDDYILRLDESGAGLKFNSLTGKLEYSNDGETWQSLTE